MTPSLIGTRFLGLAGAIGLIGCATPSLPPVARPVSRSPYPEDPLPGDRLASDPCSVKASPDLFVRDAAWEKLRPLQENLQFLKDINPAFLCGLERVELLGDDAYKASADPKYTRRSVGLYTPLDRVIRLKATAGITLTHEVGHHVHNLGYFAPTVKAFLALSWVDDPATRTRVHRCEGPDCFLNDAAASEVTEDWARTFERVLMLPVETGVAVNFSLKSPDETPMQKKVALIRSISKLPEPVKAKVSFGPAQEATADEVKAWEGAGNPKDLPAALDGETIRKIFLLGRRSIKPGVWDERRHPFLVGNVVVFPAFQKDKKSLGFFAYDLAKERFFPMVLKTENLPAEFVSAADSFTDLEIVAGPTDGLLLVGQRPGVPALAAPVEFSLER